MKTYVIKVKDNSYWLGGFYGADNYGDIAHAKIYVNKTQANKQCNLVNESYGHNAKVVEITMVEGNFDAYIDKLQDERDFERRDKTYIVKQLNDPNDYVIREDYIKLEQRNKQLEEQLSEKNKEIEDLKFEKRNLGGLIEKVSSKGQQEIRKQVCDEIRELAHNYFEYVLCEECGNNIDNDTYLSSKDLKEILDQIE